MRYKKRIIMYLDHLILMEVISIRLVSDYPTAFFWDEVLINVVCYTASASENVPLQIKCNK